MTWHRLVVSTAFSFGTRDDNAKYNRAGHSSSRLCISAEPFVPVTLRANPNVIFTSERTPTACQNLWLARAYKRNDFLNAEKRGD